MIGNRHEEAYLRVPYLHALSYGLDLQVKARVIISTGFDASTGNCIEDVSS